MGRVQYPHGGGYSKARPTLKRLWLALVLALGLGAATPALANHLELLWPFPTQFSPVMQRAMERGYLTYRLDATSAVYPNMRSQTNEVLTQMGLDTNLNFVEVHEGIPDVWMRMPEDGYFLGHCGSGAAACIDYYGDPVMVFFREALVHSNRRSAIGHEFGHLYGLHEAYRDSGGQLTCTFRQDTVMDCGSGVWRLQPRDLAILRKVYTADAPATLTSTYSDGYLFLRWDKTRKDGGTNHFGIAAQNNATRVSFAWSPDGVTFPTWVGFLGCGPEWGYCLTDFDDGNRGFDGFWVRPGSCFYMRVESAIFWSYPQSTPNYWRLVMCQPQG